MSSFKLPLGLNAGVHLSTQLTQPAQWQSVCTSSSAHPYLRAARLLPHTP